MATHYKKTQTYIYVDLFSFIHTIKIEVGIERFDHMAKMFSSNFKFDAMNEAKQSGVL